MKSRRTVKLPRILPPHSLRNLHVWNALLLLLLPFSFMEIRKHVGLSLFRGLN